MPGIGSCARPILHVSEPENREREVFNAALELPASADRAAYLDRACGDNAELRASVEALLRASDGAGGFLAEAAMPTREAVPASAEEGPGTRIGRYHLLEQIGEGGFGIVYLAEQHEPVRRRVALKIIKFGMDTRAVITRFEAERQALARMEHPNIATVLDGGATATGRPYFVMELVRGVPITEFCDQQQLPPRERMELFVQVCHAVQHAHQKGVVHRDLKPSNILVTLHDDRPVPKVIDFGVAKAIDQPLTEKTLFTRFHQFVGTPAYMSPEQTGMSGLDVDTRADIYSLGVLLYELLTGRTPFDTRALLESGYEEILRTIREREPSRPSHRLASLSLEELTTTAQRRRLDARQLVNRLRGDLDWIVMKCLQKDRQRRYATANGLAMDLARHLGNEPVLARPDTLAYRATKFVRRHRTPVAFAVLLLSVLVAGLVGTITEARRAETQRRRADEERDFALRQLSRAYAVNDLNTFLLSDAAPAGTTFTAGTLLAHAEHAVERQYGDTDENRIGMLIEIGRQYDTHDDNAKAREVLGRAYQLSRQVADRSVRAEAESALAAAIARAGDPERAEGLYRESLAELGDDPLFALTRVDCLRRGGEIAQIAWRGRQAVDRLQLAQRVLHESGLQSAVLDLRLSMGLAESFRVAGQLKEANAAFKQTFDQLKALGRDDTETAGTLLNNWGVTLHSLGQPLVAESLFRKSIDISRANGTDEHVSPMLLNNLARTLNVLGHHDEARDFAERAYDLARASGAEVIVNQALLVRAAAYFKLGDVERAAAALAEVEPRFRRTLPANHLAFEGLAGQQATLAEVRGLPAEATAKIDRAIALAEANRDSFGLALFLEQRSGIALKNDHPAEAVASAERAVHLRQNATGADTHSAWLGGAYLAWAHALQAKGEVSAANAAYASALKELVATMGADNPKSREAAEGLTTSASPAGPRPQ
jgi:serine/threonine protein kinase/tetratricopeptide (TPR) repeat protein